ncbi:MAG: IS1595 family transposase [Synechococcaceae cyanobacterium SM2_3_60]|nr:IS1595 family transposase [Synechococcaceae cyanobacterium SM2_3_60]
METRQKLGLSCRNCGCQRLYYIKNWQVFRCPDCLTDLRLKSGTVMQNSKLPLTYWYTAIYLLSHSKKPISALELQGLLGHRGYGPIWALMKKLRTAMGNREGLYRLGGRVELDEAFFTATREVFKVAKRGNGTDKMNVVVMAQTSKAAPADPQQEGTAVRFVRMKVLEDSTRESIGQTVREMVELRARVVSDANPKYQLGEAVQEHIRHVVGADRELLAREFKWVHTLISNAKRSLLGIHHSVSVQHLQDYLDEFCYRFNRRAFHDPFATFMRMAAQTSPYAKQTEPIAGSG